jgi:hypothetical protein
MYNLDYLLKIKENHLTVKEYLLFRIIEDGSLFLFKEEYIDELIKAKKESYIDNNVNLTNKAYEVLNKIEGNRQKEVNYEKLLIKLQTYLKTLSGKDQYKVQGKYNFLPNKVDFQNRLKKVILKYKLKDSNKVEKLLLKHISTAYKAGFNYVPLLQYYILKDSQSQLATDYETKIEEQKEEVISVKQIKDLF